METNNQPQKHFYTTPFLILDIFMIILSFGLAFFDMTLLSEGIAAVLRQSKSNSRLLALLLAVIANTFALGWGSTKAKGTKNLKDKNFWAWVSFGAVYFIIELVAFISGSITIVTIRKFSVQLIMLAASYTFSGLSICNSVEKITNNHLLKRLLAWRARRKYYNEYKEMIQSLEKTLTQLEADPETLKGHKKLYDIYKQNIKDNVEYSINTIAELALAGNPDLNPSEVHEIADQILSEHYERYDN